MSARTVPTTKKTSRERFVRAARHRFASQGYAATTTRQIVADAGSSMGNLYFYFRDKEGILQAVLDEATCEAARTVDEAIARVPPGPAQLAIAVITGVESLLAERELARIVFVEAPAPAFAPKPWPPSRIASSASSRPPRGYSTDWHRISPPAPGSARSGRRSKGNSTPRRNWWRATLAATLPVGTCGPPASRPPS